MTVIQLECFLEVVKQKNFSRAAANLYLSQPTLSRHIQALEGELRVNLFVRANNTVRLSAVGEKLYPRLEELYQSFRMALVDLHEIVDHHNSLLRIGVSAGLSLSEPLRAALTRMQHDAPGTRIQLCHLAVGQIYDALMNGKVDFLYAIDTSVPPSDKLYHLELEEDRMCLAVPATHPNAHLAKIDERAIRMYFPDMDLYVIDAGKFDPGVTAQLKDGLESHGVAGATSISGEFAEMDALMLMVDAGLAITIVNQQCIQQKNQHVRLIPLVDQASGDPTFQTVGISLFWVEKNENPCIQVFLDILEQI